MKYSQYFETNTRTDGTNFIALSDNAPEELKTFMQNLHLEEFNGSLPNDWIFHVALCAFEELEEQDFDEINLEADCCYKDLYRWFGESFAYDFCTEVVIEFGEQKDIYALIASAQVLAKDRIYRAVDEFMQNREEGEE